MSNNKKNKFYGVNDDLWGHKWGFKDSSFIINDDDTVTFTGKRYEGISGERLPYLIPFVTKVLNTDIKKERYFKELEKKYVAYFKLLFDSEQVQVTKNSNDEVIDGDNNQILQIKEIWTFSKNLKSKDPNWILEEIEEN